MTESFFPGETEKQTETKIPPLGDENTGAHPDSESESFRTDEGRLAALMAYIPFLCFLPLLNMRDNPEAQFHARQGVMLFLIELIAVLFLIDGVSRFVFQALLIVAAAFSVAGIYFALQGKNYKLPIVGDLVDKTKL